MLESWVDVQVWICKSTACQVARSTGTIVPARRPYLYVSACSRTRTDTSNAGTMANRGLLALRSCCQSHLSVHLSLLSGSLLEAGRLQGPLVILVVELAVAVVVVFGAWLAPLARQTISGSSGGAVPLSSSWCL